MAPGLAYGGHGFRLDGVAVMVGASTSTIPNWRKRHIEGGVMEIPGIDPGEVEHLSPKGMGEEELKRHIHELEIKPYALEETMKIIKAEGIEELSNDEKAAPIDARPKSMTVMEPLGLLAPLSGSCRYCKSKPKRTGGYATTRVAVKEGLELVRGTRGCRYIRQRPQEREEPIRVSSREERARNRGGARRRLCQEAPPLQLLRGRDQRCSGQYRPDLSRERPRQAAAHGRNAIMNHPPPKEVARSGPKRPRGAGSV